MRSIYYRPNDFIRAACKRKRTSCLGMLLINRIDQGDYKMLPAKRLASECRRFVCVKRFFQIRRFQRRNSGEFRFGRFATISSRRSAELFRAYQREIPTDRPIEPNKVATKFRSSVRSAAKLSGMAIEIVCRTFVARRRPPRSNAAEKIESFERTNALFMYSHERVNIMIYLKLMKKIF